MLGDLDPQRFTLEDAERADAAAEWVAYLYDALAGVTYRIADLAAYRRQQDRPPVAWIATLPRPLRNGRDYSELPGAISLPELALLLHHDRSALPYRDGGAPPYRVVGVHVRYAEDGDDRYALVLASEPAPDGAAPTLLVLTSAAYWTL